MGLLKDLGGGTGKTKGHHPAGTQASPWMSWLAELKEEVPRGASWDHCGPWVVQRQTQPQPEVCPSFTASPGEVFHDVVAILMNVT